jgi:hypothetical protein
MVQFLKDERKILTKIKKRKSYGWFNADEYDERRNDVVWNTFCSSRRLVNNSNGGSDQTLTTLQKEIGLSQKRKNIARCTTASLTV